MDTTQIRPGSIVVGYDGSPHSDRALAWAADQAELERRELGILHVVCEDETRTAMAMGAGVVPISPAQLIGRARSVADQGAAAVRERHPNLTITSLPRLGDPRGELVSQSGTAAMVVVGSRGRGPVTSALLGSVSAHLARHTQCAVAVCRPGHAGLVHDGVVVAADGTATSHPVLEQAFRQASLRGLPLTIAHRVDGDEALETEQVALSESITGFREKFPDVSVDLRLNCGLVTSALYNERPWNVIVVGRHPLDTLGRRIGQVKATEVMENADTTVLVVPQERT